MDAFPDLATLSDVDLKQLIDDLQKEENEVSFERRMLQGRIDILRAGGEDADVDALAAILTGKARRLEASELAPAAAAELARLQDEENEISLRRRMLHGRIDLLRTELVVRLQRSHGESVLTEVDVAALGEILAAKSAPGDEAP